MGKKIALIDIRLFLYMEYHRKNSLLNVFRNIMQVAPTTYSKIFFVYDNGKNSYIKKIYRNYKENRTVLRDKQTPAEKARYKDFSEKYNRFEEITKYFGTNIKIKGTEADTMIEVLADRFLSNGYEVHIFSNDGDFQCMLNKPNLYQITTRGEFLDAEGVVKKKGVTPEQLLISKCISGDTKDNIKGIKGLGEIKDTKSGKILKKLLQDHKDIDELLDVIQDMVDKGTRGFKLPENYPEENPVKTVKDLYNFNKQLNKSYKFEDLTEEHQKELKEQVNNSKIPFDIDDFDFKCFDIFGKSVYIDENIKRFYRI